MTRYIVYNDGEIAVALFAKNADKAKKNIFQLGVRWLKPKPYKAKDGKIIKSTNISGGETDWFLLPHSFGTVVGRRLVEQKVSGLPYFNEKGFKKMVSWLVEMEELHDCMCY